MPTYAAAYRLTCFAPRSVDPTETTVLTPIAGAAHGDPFQIITLQNVAGWKPYCGFPRGRSGRLDPLSKAVDVGEISVEVYDVRAGAPTDNLTRWVTAFFGDAYGQNRILGCKVFLEESLDGGATWAAYFTGRLSDLQLDGRLRYVFSIRDFGEDLNLLPIFTGAPHASVAQSSSGGSGYAQRLNLLPLGLSYPYGVYPVSQPLSGTVALSLAVQRNGVTYNRAQVTVAAADLKRWDNVASEELLNALPPQPKTVPFVTAAAYLSHFLAAGGTARCRLTNTGTGVTGEFVVLGFDQVEDMGTGSTEPFFRVTALYLEELPRTSATDPDPPNYLAVPAAGTAVTLVVYLDVQAQAGAALCLGGQSGVHPLQLWQDLLDGKFGYLWKYGERVPTTSVSYGDPKRTIPYSSAAFAALIADPSYPIARFFVPASTAAGPWIQTYLEAVYQLGHYFGADGKLVPLDLRRPTVLPTNTIADSDLIEGKTPAWEYAIDSAVTRVLASYYEDFPNGIGALLAASARGKAVSPGAGAGYVPTGQSGLVQAGAILQTVTHQVEILNLGRSDVAENEVDIDAQGMRAMRGEQQGGGYIPSSSGTVQVDRLSYLAAKLTEFCLALQQPFGAGAQTFSLPCRRTSASDLRPGDLTLSTVSVQPNAATNLRGGTRLLRITQRQDTNLERTLKAIDLGLAVFAAPPTLGVPALQIGSSQHGAQVTVTPNASTNQVEVHRAVVSSTVAAMPATSDGAWAFAGLATSAMTVVAQGLPGGARVFFRGRSLPSPTDPLQLPSSWAQAGAPAGAAYVDLSPLAAPTALATSTLTPRATNYTFTPGDLNLQTEVWLVTPGTDPLRRVGTLPPATAQGSLTQLVPGSSYLQMVRHRDAFGGVSDPATVVFVAPGTSAAVTATDLVTLTVLLSA